MSGQLDWLGSEAWWWSLRGDGAVAVEGVCESVEVLVGVGRPRRSGGVADPGESLAGASWPAAAALVGVAFFLGGAVVVICASSSLGSRSPGESQDPGWIRRRRRLNVVFPLGGAVLEILVPFVLPAGWTCTTSRSAGARPAVRLVWRCDACGNDDDGEQSLSRGLSF
ncbi:hypothetical protein VPH35_007618 [Triticum aestivum]